MKKVRSLKQFFRLDSLKTKYFVVILLIKGKLRLFANLEFNPFKHISLFCLTYFSRVYILPHDYPIDLYACIMFRKRLRLLTILNSTNQKKCSCNLFILVKSSWWFNTKNWNKITLNYINCKYYYFFK